MIEINKLSEHPLDRALKCAVQGKLDESERILLEECPQDDARVIFNLGWHEIRKGQLASGLRKLDAGRYIKAYGGAKINGTIWCDEPLENKTLLFRSEGGLGDEIINFRFAKEFQKRGARVVIGCSPSLFTLFSREGFICVDNNASESVYYDYWVPAMSAPHILGYDYETLSGKPYITAEPRKLYAKEGTLRVGIRWSGNPKFEHQQYRKFNPLPLIELHDIPGVTLYSLQRDNDVIEGLPFADLRHDMKTWEDTASIIAGLDLVITSCTSVAHCAAALGVETWVIVPVLSYYTWAVPGTTSNWYDSVTLFRQKQYDNWDEPFKEIRSALRSRVSLRKVA